MAMLPKQTKAVATWLAIIGALNVGLGVIGFNLVETIAQATFSGLGTLVYILVGLSGLYLLLEQFGMDL